MEECGSEVVRGLEVAQNAEMGRLMCVIGFMVKSAVVSSLQTREIIRCSQSPGELRRSLTPVSCRVAMCAGSMFLRRPVRRRFRQVHTTGEFICCMLGRFLPRIGSFPLVVYDCLCTRMVDWH